MSPATGDGPDDRPDDQASRAAGRAGDEPGDQRSGRSDHEPVDEAEAERLADELREALAPLGELPPAPTWLTTRLTAEFRRRRGELGPQRRVELRVVSDTRHTGLVGVRSGPAVDEDYTIHLRSDLDRAPEVVLDIRADDDTVAVDGLVFGGVGVAYHVRTRAGALVVDAEDTSADGRFSFRQLPPGRHRLVLDDGHDLLVADVDLSTGAG